MTRKISEAHRKALSQAAKKRWSAAKRKDTPKPKRGPRPRQAPPQNILEAVLKHVPDDVLINELLRRS